MDSAQTSEGKARFSDFKGASEISELEKLVEYNEDKKAEIVKKAEDVKESMIKDLTESSAVNVVNQAYLDYIDGHISYDQYVALLDATKNTSEGLDDETIKENASEEFIKYLKDRGMLEEYLSEHPTLAIQEKVKGLDKINNRNESQTTIFGEKQIKDMSLDEFEKAKKELLNNLDEHGQEVLNVAFQALKNGEINKNEFQSTLNIILEAEEEIEASTEQDVDVLMNGEVVFEGGSNDQHEVTKGVKGDLKGLGITYETERFENGIEVNYTVENGNFIIFKDNPELYYYTQSAEQGHINYILSGATKAYGAQYTKRQLKYLEKIPGVKTVLDKIPDGGKYFGSWWLNDNVPLVKDIIGTKIPKVGSQEVILYISEDGENWDKGVRFLIEEGKEPYSSKYSPNSW